MVPGGHRSRFIPTRQRSPHVFTFPGHVLCGSDWPFAAPYVCAYGDSHHCSFSNCQSMGLSGGARRCPAATRTSRSDSALHDGHCVRMGKGACIPSATEHIGRNAVANHQLIQLNWCRFQHGACDLPGCYGSEPLSLSRAPRCLSRSSRLRTLPAPESGSAFTNSILRGHL